MRGGFFFNHTYYNYTYTLFCMSLSVAVCVNTSRIFILEAEATCWDWCLLDSVYPNAHASLSECRHNSSFHFTFPSNYHFVFVSNDSGETKLDSLFRFFFILMALNDLFVSFQFWFDGNLKGKACDRSTHIFPQLHVYTLCWMCMRDDNCQTKCTQLFFRW